MTKNFQKFPSIESFAHVWKFHSIRFMTPTVKYGMKVKLHGTNGGIRIEPNGDVFAQSRSRDISPESDNAGFATWVEHNAHHFSARALGQTLTIYGEWAGKGIQKNDAVTQLNDKFFFVFAAKLGDYMVTSPKTLETFVPDLDNLLVLPWMMPSAFTLDFGDVEGTQAAIEELNNYAEMIGKRDWFIYETFEIDGPGEGVVMMPIDSMPRDDFSRLTFKVKAEAHRVKKTEKGASMNHEVPESVRGFVTAFVTPARVEQAVSEVCGGTYDKKNMSAYMKWMGQDIKKESEAELAEMGLEWKDVAKPVNAAASRMFLKEAEKIA